MSATTGNILITGAASGLGQALAQRLARTAQHLWLWDLNEQGLAETASGCAGVSVQAQRMDITDGKAVEAAFQRMAQDGRVPDLVYHAAGILQTGSIWEIDGEQCRRIMDVNYQGTVHVVMAASRVMPAGGRIICMGSVAGIKGLPEFASYCASKFAVVGFCEAVHGELASRGISLSVVCPPAIDTPMVRNLTQRPALYDIFPFAPKDVVVTRILEAVEDRDAFLVLVDRQSALLHKVNGLFPGTTSRVLGWLVERRKRRASVATNH
ncbi:MAG: SDR family oxidoreductase [Myxococcota bacterium]